MLRHSRWLKNRFLVGLGLSLIFFMLTSGTWRDLQLFPAGASPAEAVVEDTCSKIYAPPPLGPQRPTKLVALRNLEEASPEPQQVISLLWINRAQNANCFFVEVKYSPGQGTGVSNEWLLLDTIRSPRVNQYQHQNVKAQGQVCYRVYASNRTGRSEYSNRVCLVLGKL